MRRVGSPEAFREFLDQLDQTERLPIVVVSLPPRPQPPLFPIEELEAELGDAAHLWAFEPHATFWLTDEIGKRLSVYSGWVRVYPSNPQWRTEERRAPLLPERADRRRWLRAVVDAVLDAAYRDGYRPAVAASGSALEVATVSGVLTATQALVETADRRQAAMRTHHLWPGLPAQRLVAPGQKFEGYLGSGLLPEFIPNPPQQDVPARVAAFVGDGVITLARVRTVGDHCAELLVHPEYAITIENAGTDLRALVARDEIVTVEIVPVDGAFLATFSSDDPAPAMSVLPGGPPWLFREVLTKDDGPVPPRTREKETPGAGGWLYEEIERLEQEVARLEEQNRQLRRRARERTRIVIPRVYSDPIEQIRLELHLAYLSRVPEPDRDRYPWLQQYSITPTFAASLEDLVRNGGITREKIIEVCVEVLCGLATKNGSRAVKEWLESRHGRPLVRDDGATAWRVRLQHKSNAARRLRYWRLRSGAIELDWVGVHDANLR